MEKRLIVTIGMAIWLSFSVGCQRPTGLSEADRTAIRQLGETDMKMKNAKDWMGDMALYTEDAIELPGGHAQRGRQRASRSGGRGHVELAEIALVRFHQVFERRTRRVELFRQHRQRRAAHDHRPGFPSLISKHFALLVCDRLTVRGVGV